MTVGKSGIFKGRIVRNCACFFFEYNIVLNINICLLQNHNECDNSEFLRGAKY